MAGRQISNLETKYAQDGTSYEYGTSRFNYCIYGDTIVIKSKWWAPFQTHNWCSTRKTYTLQGLLKSTETEDWTGKKETVIYDPPGRVVGKKVVPEKAAA